MTGFRRVPGARATLIALAVLLLSGSGLAQQRTLTVEEIYDPEQRVDFSGRTPSGLTWLSDTRYLQRERDPANRATRLLSVDADTGAAEPLLDVEELETALAALPGMSDSAARRAVRAGRFVWDLDHTAVVMNISNDLYYFGVHGRDSFGAVWVRRLTRDPAESRCRHSARTAPSSRSSATTTWSW